MAPKRVRKEPQRFTYDGDEHLLGSKKVKKCKDKKKNHIKYENYKKEMAKKKVAKKVRKSQVRPGGPQTRQPKKKTKEGQKN